MSDRTEYQFPVLQPFSNGQWTEVVLAWVAAAIVMAVLLLML